jgi:purine-cytosine permease-like protein
VRNGKSLWVAVGWTAIVVATILTGLVVGYFAVHFQLFGDAADAEDYRVAAGAYGAAAAVLVVGALGILTHPAPRWLTVVALVAAGGLGVLASNSLDSARGAESDPVPINTVWDGIGGVLWAPWTWVLVAAGMHGLYVVTRRAVHGAGAPDRARKRP